MGPASVDMHASCCDMHASCCDMHARLARPRMQSDACSHDWPTRMLAPTIGYAVHPHTVSAGAHSLQPPRTHIHPCIYLIHTCIVQQAQHPLQRCTSCCMLHPCVTWFAPCVRRCPTAARTSVDPCARHYTPMPRMSATGTGDRYGTPRALATVMITIAALLWYLATHGAPIGSGLPTTYV
jgi:hypothetical protein